jgi:hypothetical protein
MAKRTYDDPRPGQIWRDLDPRMLSGNRRVRVTETYRDGAGPNDVHVKYRAVTWHGDMIGRELRSRWDRFQRAFALVRSVDAVRGRSENQS